MMPPLTPRLPQHGTHIMRDCHCLSNIRLPLPKCELRRPRTMSGLLTRALAHSCCLINACGLWIPTTILEKDCQALSLGTPH